MAEQLPAESQRARTRDARHTTIATAVAALSLLYAIIQGVSTGYFNRRWKDIEYLTSQRTAAQEDLRRLVATPRVRIKTTTLAGAELSDEMRRELPLLPSTVQVKNMGGGTARGITISIYADVPIEKVVKWASPDSFVVHVPKGEQSSVILTVPQLRNSSGIGVTILTHQVPHLRPDVIISEGTVSDPDSLMAMALREVYFSPYLDGSKARDIMRRSATVAEASLNLKVAVLDAQIDALQQESFWNWIGDQLSSTALLFILFCLVGATPLILALRRDLAKKKTRTAVALNIRNGSYTNIPLQTVLLRLGGPDAIAVPASGEGNILEVVYFSEYALLPNTKGITLVAHNLVIDDVRDEHGVRMI